MQRHTSSRDDSLKKTAECLIPIVKTLYDQIFITPNEKFTPSPSSSSCIEENSAAVATENRLYLARLTLEYQELVARYGLCLTHLQEAVKEAEDLREQNVKLRAANLDLTKRLTLLTQVSLGNRYLSSGFPSLSIINDFRNLCVGDNGNGGGLNNHVSSGDVSDNSSTTVVENKRFEKKSGGDERVALPKSISSGYLKAKQPGGSSASSNGINRPRSVSPVDNETGGNKEEEAREIDVFNQRMFKSEINNKRQEDAILIASPYEPYIVPVLRTIRRTRAKVRTKPRVARQNKSKWNESKFKGSVPLLVTKMRYDKIGSKVWKCIKIGGKGLEDALKAWIVDESLDRVQRFLGDHNCLGAFWFRGLL